DAGATTTTAQGNDFMRLVNQAVVPRDASAEQANRVESALQSFIKAAGIDADTQRGNANEAIRTLIAKIDVTLGQQLDQVLHHSTFQRMEGAWRGLKYLVDNTESDEKLQIKVMHASKDELRKMFQNYEGTAWDQSPLFKQIYESEYGRLGGEPF